MFESGRGENSRGYSNFLLQGRGKTIQREKMKKRFTKKRFILITLFRLCIILNLITLAQQTQNSALYLIIKIHNVN